MLATVPNWRFSSRSRLEPNWNRCNRFNPLKKLNRTEPAVFWRFLILAQSQLWLQLSIWVLIVSQYHIYVKDSDLDALSPPILQFAIRVLVVELLWKNTHNWAFFEVTQWMLIGSQIEEREVKEQLTVHLLRIYHIVIQSKLKYFIGPKVPSSRK